MVSEVSFILLVLFLIFRKVIGCSGLMVLLIFIGEFLFSVVCMVSLVGGLLGLVLNVLILLVSLVRLVV